MLVKQLHRCRFLPSSQVELIVSKSQVIQQLRLLVFDDLPIVLEQLPPFPTHLIVSHKRPWNRVLPPLLAHRLLKKWAPSTMAFQV